MDEILIEEKKYVSSKRAAKLTGYAKDYIGQLCREGRVPARLVGRSWYVLESAIQDHRFGPTDTEPEKEGRSVSPRRGISQEWEAPRYEASQGEALPVIKHEPEVDTAPTTQDANQVSIEKTDQHLQDSWREWFDRIAHTGEVLASSSTQEQENLKNTNQKEEVEQTDRQVEEAESVNIPLNTIHELPPENLLPRQQKTVAASDQEDQKWEYMEPQERVLGGSFLTGIFGVGRAVAVVFAATALSIAVISSGYFDKYIASASQASVITGITLYNK